MPLAGEISWLFIPTMKTAFLQGQMGGTTPFFSACDLNEFNLTTASKLWSVGLTAGVYLSRRVKTDLQHDTH
jgi:hypothetical protein